MLRVESNWRKDVPCYENVTMISRWNLDEGGEVKKRIVQEASIIEKTVKNSNEKFLGLTSLAQGDFGDGVTGLQIPSGESVSYVNSEDSESFNFWERLEWVRERKVTKISGIYHEDNGFRCEIYTSKGVVDLGVFTTLMDAIMKRLSEEERYYGESSWVTNYHHGELESVIELAKELLERREEFCCVNCAQPIQHVRRFRRGGIVAPQPEEDYISMMERLKEVPLSDIDVIICPCARCCVAIYELFEVGSTFEQFRKAFFSSDSSSYNVSVEVENNVSEETYDSTMALSHSSEGVGEDIEDTIPEELWENIEKHDAEFQDWADEFISNH